MEYRWRCQDERGREIAGAEEQFTDQVDAEDWLTAEWQDLLAAGVTQVTLLHGEAEVYGPMSLLPAS